MTSMLQRGKDKLVNGVILGALFGAMIIWGAQIYTWLQTTVPTTWLVLGEFSLPVYIIGLGALAGYLVDRI